MDNLLPEQYSTIGSGQMPDPEEIRKVRRLFRRKILGAILLTIITTAASAMSCVGQSFSYRQAKALERIQMQLGKCR